MSSGENYQLNSFKKRVDLTALLNMFKNDIFLPIEEEGSLKNSNGEHPNPIMTTAPQRVYANINMVTKPGVYNEPLPLAKVRGTLFHHP